MFFCMTSIVEKMVSLNTEIMYKVIFIDDHPILTDGLKRMFDQDPLFQIVGTFRSSSFALAYLSSTPNVDLVVLDYAMPDLSGKALIEAIQKLPHVPKIIMLTMHDEPAIVKEVWDTGISGYVLKKSASDELRMAMLMVMQGNTYWSQEIGVRTRQFTNDDVSDEHLTLREKEILKLITQELTNKEIARLLHISERTVEVHRKNLMRKTSSTNAVGLIKYALQHHLLDEE
jgi:two-component system nitrate/nitrite response regulator NarL